MIFGSIGAVPQKLAGTGRAANRIAVTTQIEQEEYQIQSYIPAQVEKLEYWRLELQ